MVRARVSGGLKKVYKHSFPSNVWFLLNERRSFCRRRHAEVRRRCDRKGLNRYRTVREPTWWEEKGFSAGSSRNTWPFSAATWAERRRCESRHEKRGPSARVFFLIAQLGRKAERHGENGRRRASVLREGREPPRQKLQKFCRVPPPVFPHLELDAGRKRPRDRLFFPRSTLWNSSPASNFSRVLSLLRSRSKGEKKKWKHLEILVSFQNSCSDFFSNLHCVCVCLLVNLS